MSNSPSREYFYMVIKEKSTNNLSDKVKQQLGFGWLLQGGIATYTETNKQFTERVYVQAMYKEQEKLG